MPGRAAVPLTGSPWAPLHWVLGVGSYGLFGAAVLHATMLDAAETRMRQHAGGPPRAFGMPLLQLERLTFRFVEAGFRGAERGAGAGHALTSPQWRWTHKTVFSLLGWAVIAAHCWLDASCRAGAAGAPRAGCMPVRACCCCWPMPARASSWQFVLGRAVGMSVHF